MGDRNRARAKETFTVDQHAARVGELLGMRLLTGPLQRTGSD
jgi:hypothetical protein